MMVIAISFVLSSVILNTTFKNVTTHLSQNLKIPVYFNKDVTLEDIQRLQADFANDSRVAGVVYVNQQEAKERFTTSYDDIEIGQAFTLVGDDILPPSLEVSVFDLNQIDAIIAIASSPDYQDIVDSNSLDKTDAHRTIDRAIEIQDTLIRVSVAVVSVFGVVAFLIIFNTIRMAIFSRREEIQIMRLIGAPVRFIREPFLVEAGLYGVAGGLIAFGLIYGLIWSFSDTITGSHELVSSYAYFAQNKGVIFLMFIGAIGSGVIFSTLSCVLALQTHLRI